MSTLKAKTIQPVGDSDTLVLRTGGSDSLTLDLNGNATIRGELIVDGINIGQGPNNYETNTRIGLAALASTTTVNPAGGSPWNTAVGRSALTSLTTSYYNTAVGGQALRDTTIGLENTGIGLNAGVSNVDGDYNVAVGSRAGPSTASLDFTTCIGWNALASATNSVALGAGSIATEANSIYLGNSTVNKLFMGNGSAVAPAFVCRAWVNFDGTLASLSPRAHGNISSITDDGVGLYTVSFVNAMIDRNYCVVFGTRRSNVAETDPDQNISIGVRNGIGNYNTMMTASAVKVITGYPTATGQTDFDFVSVAIFR
jgi:hypothetical protein